MEERERTGRRQDGRERSRQKGMIWRLHVQAYAEYKRITVVRCRAVKIYK